MVILARAWAALRSLVATALSRSWLMRVARLALLLVIVAAGWCVTQNRVSLRSWQTPLNYGTDTLFILARMQSAAQGHYWHRLASARH